MSLSTNTCVRSIFLTGFLLNLPTVHAARVEDLMASRSLETLNREHEPESKRPGPQGRAESYAEIFNLETDSTFKVLDSDTLKGLSNYRFQQIYRGVPVQKAIVVLSEDAEGRIRYLDGDVVYDLATDVPSTEAVLSTQRALDIAKRIGLTGKLAGFEPEIEKVEKLIYVDDRKLAHLAYQVSMYVPHPTEPTQPTFIIDATTGEVLKQWNATRNANATGPGGNPKTGQYEYGTLRGYLDVTQSGTTCTMENAKVRTRDMNNTTATSPLPPAYSFTCPRNTTRVANQAFSPLNDAHYYGSITHDMFTSYVGQAPWGSTKLQFNVHFGVGYSNAQWVALGEWVDIGDGNGVYYPFSVLDLVAHEVAHGYTARHSALDPSEQPGAIDEAFSDMAGEASEYFYYQANGGGNNNFEVGRAAVKDPAKAIRYMVNPPNDGTSIGHASNWVPSMDAHRASGVYNKAFYSLANKNGWNTRKAFEVFARANRFYWRPTTNFDRGACGVETAAQDLSYSRSDVTSAFAVVGVSCKLTWDPTWLSYSPNYPGPVYTNSDKTVSNSAQNSIFAVLGTMARSTGKRYLEFKIGALIDSPQAGASSFSVGLWGPLAGPDEPYCGGTNTFCVDFSMDYNGPNIYTTFWANGEPTDPWWDPGTGTFVGSMLSYRVVAGDTIGVAVDLDSGKIWLSRNGNWVGSPSTGTSAVYDQSFYLDANNQISGKSHLPFMFSYFADLDLTIRGTSSEFAYATPTGFVPWSNP